MAAVERWDGQQIEHGEEDVDEDEVQRIGRQDRSSAALRSSGEHDRSGQQGRAEERKQKVHPRTRERDQNHIAARVAKARVVDRNRLRPAEDRRMADRQ